MTNNYIKFLIFLSLLVTSLDSFSSELMHPPLPLKYRHQVQQLLTQANSQELWQNLITLTQFPDRSSSHQTGVEAANWIQNQIKTLIISSGRKDATVFTVATDAFDGGSGTQIKSNQYSIVLKIGNSNLPGILVGAHFDTLACGYEANDGYHDDDGCYTDPDGPLPGADDDGSGTAALLELSRTLLNSHLTFKKPIYITWYAAEEIGLIGSKSVVDDFVAKKIPLDAVLQLDQIGYEKNNDPTIWIYSGSNNDPDLVKFMQELGTQYLRQPVKLLSRNGDSDDWNWHHAGYKTVRAVEGDEESPYTHTSADTLATISLPHLFDYLKLTIAYVVELAEPRN